MNITSTTTLAFGIMSPQDLHSSIGGAFFGFTLGAILFGITLRQAYQYYTTNISDSVFRKSLIAIICSLDFLNLLFGVYMVYSFILLLVGFPDRAPQLLWSLKALVVVQAVLVVLVQCFYLSQIWLLSKNLHLLPRRFTRVVQFFVVFAAVFALATAIFFLQELGKISTIIGFSPEIEYVVYIGFASTAFLDCTIAAAMCLILHRSNGGATRRTESVVETLIQYFVATGLMTSFAAIMCISLYVAQPATLLYFGLEFSMTRLYANSILAMFNARKQLRQRLEESVELKLPTNILFGEPEPQNILLMRSNPFSSSAETKYSECAYSTRGRKDKDTHGMHIRNYTL